MKKYVIFAASALALASCSSDDVLGDGQGTNPNNTDAIQFNSNAGNTTRANLTGATAAGKLQNNFIVFGYKSGNTTVYDHYSVNWNGKANETESNTAGWEYVGQTKNSLNETGGAQSIKYWDYSASQYDFVAFSFGEATQGTTDDDVLASRVDNTPKYTLTGKVENLAKCYIADRVTAKNNATEKEYKQYAYGKPVVFNFRSLGTKVNVGFYETIPGYSVKDVKFYTSDTDATGSDKATLYAAAATIPAEGQKGKMTVTFGSNTETAENFNQAKVAWEVADGSNNSSTIAFEQLQTSGKEDAEADAKYLGRTLATASKPAEFKTILPVQPGELKLKVDYTLVSTDGSAEEIKVKGATAVIPAQFTNWQPNFAYTYIFKISDKTNGGTGTVDDPKGLYPITFDAVVTETEEGVQNTITSVSDPSITTYAFGAFNNEYKAGQNIYVSVENKALSTTGDAVNAALYTAKMETGTKTINEAYVALCLKNKKYTSPVTEGPWTLDDGTNKLTVTSSDLLSIVTSIPANERADGNTLNGNFAKFTPAAAGTYVFEYTYKDADNNEQHVYKVIQVAAAE